MEKIKTKLEHSVEELEQLGDRTNLALTEMRLQFETMAELQKEERIATERTHNEDKEKMRKHYGRVICCLIIALLIIVSGLVGTFIFVVANYDFEDLQHGYKQEMYIGGNGVNILNEGYHSGDK